MRRKYRIKSGCGNNPLLFSLICRYIFLFYGKQRVKFCNDKKFFSECIKLTDVWLKVMGFARAGLFSERKLFSAIVNVSGKIRRNSKKVKNFTCIFSVVMYNRIVGRNTADKIKYAVLAELADAHGSGPCGKPWGFESLRPHQRNVENPTVVTVGFLLDYILTTFFLFFDRIAQVCQIYLYQCF